MRVLLAALLALCAAAPLRAEQAGERFVWSQWRHAGGWDPYPGVHREVAAFLRSVTSVLCADERRELDLSDPALFSTPMLVLSGRQEPPALQEEERRVLRDWLGAGGFLWIDDASGLKVSPFDRWTRSTLRAALPDAELRPLPQDHVLFKTFFLARRVGGRASVSGVVEGVDWGGRTAVVYTRDDVLGALARDPLGRPVYELSEARRLDARKLTLNIVMYALTGSYKADAVHQPFILEKMRQGAP